MKRKKKVYLIILTSLLLLICISGGFIGNYFYNLALNPNVPKDMIFGSKEETEVNNYNWILNSAGFVDENVVSDDGLNLHAYEVLNENPTNKWVITVHGYTGKGSDMDGYAEGFYNMGYNVLVPDLRGHGESDGSYIGMGWQDRLDIMKWINYIISVDNNAEIVLHGVSMGAATVMMTAGEDLPQNVKCIIEDSGYTSVWNEFSYQLKRLFNLPEIPVLQLASIVARIRAGYWLSDASAINCIAKAEKPILFIHGDEDDFVPYYMLDELYNKASVEKDKLVVSGAKHAKSLETNKEVYFNTIQEFTNKYVK